MATHASSIWSQRCVEVDRLRALVPTAISLLSLPDTVAEATECFTEILQSFPNLFDSCSMQLLSEQLTSQASQSVMDTLLRGIYDDETMPFARLLVAFGNVAVADIAQTPGSQITQQLSDLMRCQGYDWVEEVSGLALAFWQKYVTFLTDMICSHEGRAKPEWMPYAHARVLEIVEACLHKACWPPEPGALVWQEYEIDNFHSFRKEAQELFEATYIYMGVELFVKIVDIALNSQEQSQRNRLEASIFILNGLSDSSISTSVEIDRALSTLFTSGTIFDAAENARGFLSLQLKLTMMEMITGYTWFYEKHPILLAPLLNFLFDALQNPKIANVSSLAIQSVCSSCRKHLVSELGTFLQLCTTLLSQNSLGADIREQIVGGIASIVQALPSDEARYSYLTTLLRLTYHEFAVAIRRYQNSELVAANQGVVHAMRLLVSIGKALRAPDHVSNPINGSTFWSCEIGATLQMNICRMMAQANKLAHSNDQVIEAICEILRTGYGEIAPGPFTFPPKVTVDFVLASSIGTARLESVFETAAAMLAKKPNAPSVDLQDAAYLMLNHGRGLLCSTSGM